MQRVELAMGPALVRCQFPGYTFDEGRQVGLIAQDLQSVLPQAVKPGKDGYLSVAYDRVVPVLVEAVKELSGKVDSRGRRLARQQHRLAVLERTLQEKNGQIDDLEVRLDRLEAMVFNTGR